MRDFRSTARSNVTLAAMALVVHVACATPCPPGTAPDPSRTARIAASGHQVCFGLVPERGLRDQTGRFLLDEATDDQLLAARVVHLKHHVADLPAEGEACRALLLTEEANAWTAELAHRRLLGRTDAACPLQAALGTAPSVEAVGRWLATSAEPTPTRLRAGHAARCGTL